MIKVGPARFSLKQQIGKLHIKSPIIDHKWLAPTIKSALDSKMKVVTVDFALGRSRSALQNAGISETNIASLMKFNFDHHDGINTGKTATEVTLSKISTLKGKYIVLSDSVIDADNVCATFAAMNPKKAKLHADVLKQVARYGDYYDEAGDHAMKAVLTIDSMRFGKNKFGKPFFLLNQAQKEQLFNDILENMPKMLDSISSFKELYEGELGKLSAARERALAKNLAKPVSVSVAVVTEDAFPRAVAYQISDRQIVISMKDLGDGKFNYNPVGVNPRVADRDLSGLWGKLREAENKKRLQLRMRALDPSESWGGRNVAGGSAKDQAIGSILTLEEVTKIIEDYLTEQNKR